MVRRPNRAGARKGAPCFTTSARSAHRAVEWIAGTQGRALGRNNPMASGERSLRVCWLYPEHMNLYGDRGNVVTFEQRCRPRGIDFQLIRLGPGDRFDGAAYALVFTGGGPDSTQLLVADDLREG